MAARRSAVFSASEELVTRMSTCSLSPRVSISIWPAGVAVGLAVLWRYASRPGLAAAAPGRWPDAVGVARAADRATLLVSVHARCPCSRASLAELGEIAGRSRGRLLIYVL